MLLLFFFLIIGRPPISPLFPYTPLFRSGRPRFLRGGQVLIRAFDPVVRSGARASGTPVLALAGLAYRSEEHTSELQSHVNLVCRLLLEKKKTSYLTGGDCAPDAQH